MVSGTSVRVDGAVLVIGIRVHYYMNLSESNSPRKKLDNALGTSGLLSIWTLVATTTTIERLNLSNTGLAAGDVPLSTQMIERLNL
jgi:hypothetical protein